MGASLLGPAARVFGTILAAWLLTAAPAAAGSAAGSRVLSTSLCADQFALALLEPARIVSVSRQAADPELSVHWRQAGPLAKNRGSAEEILLSDADVVIADAWSVSRTRDFLEARGVEVIALPLLEDVESILALTVEVARRLGVEARGHALVADFHARLAAVRSRRGGPAPRGLYLSPGGTTAGAGSFGDAVLVEGGVRNIAAGELGRTGWGTVGLEEAVLADPDLLVFSFFREQALSMTQRIRFHSAFRALRARKPAATIESRDWICSGWFLILAIEDLAADVGRLHGSPP